ncbi:hypothetical protein [Pseudoalteromonas nigrifaciens]|uniref:hypothetical protein n=1 Tax=Pseudoalteromonas nigrifaciens TaxID=28109 RepID=UPI003FD08ED4
MKNYIKCGKAALLTLFTTSAVAEDFDIGEAPSGPMGDLVGFVQDVVNTLSGPGVFAVGFVSLFIVVVLWVFAPKAGPVMAIAMRVAIGVIILLNLPLWFAYLGG